VLWIVCYLDQRGSCMIKHSANGSLIVSLSKYEKKKMVDIFVFYVHIKKIQESALKNTFIQATLSVQKPFKWSFLTDHEVSLS
jgi:hypothetical protein